MTRQLVPCPHCAGSGWVKAQPTRRHRGPVIVNGQRFDSSVAALATNLGKFPPSSQEFAPEFEGVLSPGESRRSTLYHQWSTGDVVVSGLIAVVSGSLVGLSSVPICIAAHAKWYWPFIIWTGSTTIMWFVKVTDFFTDDKAVIQSQEQERVAEPAPVVVEPPAAEVVVQVGKSQRRARLKAPKGNHAGLWRYAEALVSGRAAPSYEGGKEVLGAKAYGYTPAEFDAGPGTWRPTAIAAGLLEEDPHKSKGYRVTRSGKRALAVIAERKLGEWG